MSETGGPETIVYLSVWRGGDALSPYIPITIRVPDQSGRSVAQVFPSEVVIVAKLQREFATLLPPTVNPFKTRVYYMGTKEPEPSTTGGKLMVVDQTPLGMSNDGDKPADIPDAVYLQVVFPPCFAKEPSGALFAASVAAASGASNTDMQPAFDAALKVARFADPAEGFPAVLTREKGSALVAAAAEGKEKGLIRAIAPLIRALRADAKPEAANADEDALTRRVVVSSLDSAEVPPMQTHLLAAHACFVVLADPRATEDSAEGSAAGPAGNSSDVHLHGNVADRSLQRKAPWLTVPICTETMAAAESCT